MRGPFRLRYVLLLAAGTVFAAAWGGWLLLLGGATETTDNAYVQGNVIHVTAQTAGTVASVLADDTDPVRAGQVLVQLDPLDAHLALKYAEAELAETVRQVRSVYGANASLAAQVTLRQAEAARVRSEVDRIRQDLQRREPLVTAGAISGEELQHAKAALDIALSMLAGAQASVSAAREQLLANQTLTDGTSVEQHPRVRAAATRMMKAWVASRRVVVSSPVDGQVAKRTVQPGQRIAAGAHLLAVIPLHDVWVEANFKEAQLRRIRVGQPATLHADLYGAKVAYEGRVAGLGAGTGATFALLPPQNATGNWIKVVQRVPVRIALVPGQLASHPLRVGLSMRVAVDVAEGARAAVSKAAPKAPPSAATEPPSLDAQAQAAAREVILQHTVRSGHRGARAVD